MKLLIPGIVEFTFRSAVRLYKWLSQIEQKLKMDRIVLKLINEFIAWMCLPGQESKQEQLDRHRYNS